MRKFMKLSLTLVLACVMLFSVAVIASAETTPTASGDCGTNLTWEYYEDTQTLKIKGTGAMQDFGSAKNYPWYSNRASIVALELPNGLTSIPKNAFYEFSALKEVTIPDSVETIGGYAFFACSSLDSINMGTGIESIAKYAFTNAKIAKVNVKSLEAWVNISFADYTANPISRSANLYLNNELVTEYNIPESVTSISAYAFYGCATVEKIFVPNSVTEIGANAFKYCSGLVVGCYDGSYAETYCKDNSVKYAINRDDATVSGSCSDTVKWYYYEDTKTFVIEGDGPIPSYTNANRAPWYNYTRNATTIEIGDGITAIGGYAFFKAGAVETIVIPDKVASIGQYAFSECSSLQRFFVGTGLKRCYGKAFFASFNIKEVHISDIAQWCGIQFDDYQARPSWQHGILYLNGALLTDIVIPDGVTEIKKYAFQRTTAESLVIPDSVQKIGYMAFYDTKLKTVTFGNGLKEVGDYAFYGNTQFTNLNVTDVATMSGINYASYSATPSRITKTIYVNGVLVKDLIIPDGVTNIESYVFWALRNNTSITIPETVVSSGSLPFGYNENARIVYGVPGSYAETLAKSKVYCSAQFVDVANKPQVSVTNVTLPSESIDMKVGETEFLVATLTPSNATNEAVTWKSNNENVAVVVGGTIKAVGVGNAVITVTADGGVTDTCAVNVESASIPVIGVSLNLGSLTINNGESYTLLATVKPANAVNKAINWTSDAESVVTVEDGVLTTVGIGTATITATTVDGGYTATCKVTVVEIEEPEIPEVKVTGVTLDTTSATINLNETLQLNATVEPDDAANKDVVWSSDNEAVATVVDGLVTAVGAGDATITVKTVDGEFTATCEVTVELVQVDLEAIDIVEEQVELIVGDEYTLTVNFLPAGAAEVALYWEAVDTEVVDVVDGVLTAVGVGTTEVVVYDDETWEFSDTVTVTVTEGVKVTGVTLNKTSSSLALGYTEQLKANLEPADATEKAVTWESSDEAVVTVVDGLVTAVGSGEATVKVTTVDGGFEATCTYVVVTGNETPALPWNN